MDMDAPIESLKAGKARKKKEPDLLEVERQKELVRYMKRWFSSGKGRTQNKLSNKARVAKTTISDALKPETITNSENTLAILGAILSRKEMLLFFAKHFPLLMPAIELAVEARGNIKMEMHLFLKFAAEHMDPDGKIRWEAMESVKDAMTKVIRAGFLYSEEDKALLIGGTVRGVMVQVSSVTFENIANEQKEKIVKVGGVEYQLLQIDLESKVAVFQDSSSGKMVTVFHRGSHDEKREATESSQGTAEL